MTDEQHSTPEHGQMPDAPWWSQPGSTAVLPDVQEPLATPYPPPIDPRPKRRPGTTGLLALALIVGGGVGGATAAALDDDTPFIAATPLSPDPVTGGGRATVSGTPESAAAVIAPSVVTIAVSGERTSVFDGAQRTSGTGSGIIIRTSGFILTNNHVVAPAVGGGAVHVTLDDGTTVPATIVGTDPSIDLAVLRIEGAAGLRAATFADSERLKVGQAVLAVGAPLGLSNTITQGIVSTLHRPVRTGDSTSQQAVIDAVQTDAAINPGNSGGALVDLAGRVVGVNSAIATTGGGGGQAGNIGVGFAIPSNAAVRIADQLIATGKATHSQIGVNVGDAPNSTTGAPGLGASIRSVAAGSPADKAGIRTGDVVTKVNDRLVTDADSLIVAIRSHNPGTTVTVLLTRGGNPVTVRVTLAGVTS